MKTNYITPIDDKGRLGIAYLAKHNYTARRLAKEWGVPVMSVYNVTNGRFTGKYRSTKNNTRRVAEHMGYFGCEPKPLAAWKGNGDE